jgi:hypothetical protein
MSIAAPIAMLVYPRDFVVPAAAALLSLGAACFAGVNAVQGVWRFTAAHPVRAGQPSDSDLRGLIRLSAAGTAVGAAISLSLLCVISNQELAALAGLVGLIAFLCCHIAALVYLRRLALRMSKTKEARAARIVTIAFLAGIGMTPVGGLGWLDPIWADLYVYVSAAGACLIAALLIAFLIVANRFYVLLDATARGSPTTDDPGMAAEIASKTFVIMGSS